MAKIFYGMNQSLDGYVDHDRFAPDPTLFRHFIDQTHALTGSLYGRGLYELMAYWDEDQPGWDEAERDFAAAWRSKPKWVVSRSLNSVGPNATLVEGDLAAFVRRLKAEHDGEIEVGGPVLAQSAAKPADIPAAELYRAQTIVTGTGETNRIIGFAACLEDVLVKASGQLRLAGDPRLGPYKADAAKLVRDFSYRDEKGGKPKNDEQGTRDRSFVLTAEFDATAVNGILDKLGAKPWLSHRPVLGMFVEMQNGARRYLVAADSKETELQRAALDAAAAKRGMKVVLPDAAELTGIIANGEALAAIAPARLAELAAARGAEAVLVAHLVDDRALRWTSQWRIDWQGKSLQWQAAAVTFDEAFRQGIGAAAQIIAGAP